MVANVAEQVFILTLIMLVGAGLRRGAVITDAVNQGLARLLMTATLPATIIASFNFKFSWDMAKSGGEILAISAIWHGVAIVICTLLYSRFGGTKKNIYSFATVFSNCGFMGYPVIQGIYGNMGIFYTSIFSIPVNFYVFSYGIILFTGQSDLKTVWRNLVNLPFIATIVGCLIFALSIPIPDPLMKTLDVLGSMTTPLSMLIVGGMLGRVRLADVFRFGDIYLFSAIKLIVAPLACYLALRAMNVDAVPATVCILLVAMPTASILGVMVERYDGDRVLASRCTALTTLLSLLTIPAVVAGL